MIWNKDCRSGLLVTASASWLVDRGFDPQPRQTKVFKTGSSGFPTHPLTLGIMGIALRLARQCQDNELVNYWLKIVQETWILLTVAVRKVKYCWYGVKPQRNKVIWNDKASGQNTKIY